MSLSHRTHPVARVLAGGVLAASVLALAGCGNDPVESEADAPLSEQDIVDEGAAEDDPAGGDVPEDAEIDEPFDGPLDSAFFDNLDAYEGSEVTITAQMEEMITPTSFVAASSEDPAADRLLVISETALPDVEAGTELAVTGTLRGSFDMPIAEEELGVNLDDALYEEWDGEPYIEATNVETTAASD